MADTQPTDHAQAVHQVPEWEHIAAQKEAGTAVAAPAANTTPGTSWRTQFDARMAPHRRYFGMSRKLFLLVLVGVTIALLALVIGLAAGLTGKSKSSKNLPLPSNSDQFIGDLTYYGTGLGACGITSGDSDDIVSVSHIIFDAAGSSSSQGGNSNNNPLCNRMLRASRFDQEVGAQRSIDLRVVDRCTGCQPDDLDTSLGAFEKLAPSASGRVDVTWAWLQAVQTGS